MKRLWWRCRFRANAEDSRPVKFPPPGSFWETGIAGDGSYSIVVAYLRDKRQLKKFWPEASQPEWETQIGIEFSSRFQRPAWWKGKP